MTGVQTCALPNLAFSAPLREQIMRRTTRQDAKNAKRIRGKRYLAFSVPLREQIMRRITRQDAKNAKRIRGKRT